MKPRTIVIIGAAMAVVFVAVPLLMRNDQPIVWQLGKAMALIAIALPALELGVRLGARLATRVLSRLHMHPSDRDVEVTQKPITPLNIAVVTLTMGVTAAAFNWQMQGFTSLAKLLFPFGLSAGLATLMTAAITFARSLARAIEDDDFEVS